MSCWTRGSRPGTRLTIWAAFLGMQAVLTVPAFAVDRERLRDLWTLPVQLVFYRQLMYLVMIHSLATALTGRPPAVAQAGPDRRGPAGPGQHSDRAGVKVPAPATVLTEQARRPTASYDSQVGTGGASHGRHRRRASDDDGVSRRPGWIPVYSGRPWWPPRPGAVISVEPGHYARA